jgi:hypothetical protein
VDHVPEGARLDEGDPSDVHRTPSVEEAIGTRMKRIEDRIKRIRQNTVFQILCIRFLILFIRVPIA